MSEIVLKTLSERYGNVLENKLRDYLTRSADPEFAPVIVYHIATGGKRVRPFLTLAFAEACNEDPAKALPEACAVELVHEYSLIFDDIIDHSTVRRGKPTVWKMYGHSIAILVGLWYREAIEEAILESHNPPLVAKILSEAMREIIEGERLDILLEAAGRDDPYVVDNRIVNRLSLENLEEIYMKMIRKKTAALIRTACILGALVATKTLEHEYVKAAETYGECIGIAFQLIDDLLDIYGKFEKFGKEIGKDLKEHKLGNAIVVYTLLKASQEDRDRILNILRKDIITEKDIEEAIKIFDKYNAKEHVKELARQYMNKAINAIRILPNSETVKQLEGLARFIVEREY